MIPRDYITGWRRYAPWVQDVQVEQDLVISRALVEIYRVASLADQLALRGGTALNKLFVLPASRYSEDIDLVQVRPEPIGEILDQLRSVLDPVLGAPRRQLKEGRVNLVYRLDSEDAPPLRMRLKIEVNSREHFTELGLLSRPVEVENRRFEGQAQVTTYRIEELMGTKLRALYQRKKGRDLFDLAHTLAVTAVDSHKVVSCFQRYLNENGLSVSRAQFEENLAAKLDDPRFTADIGPLLRPGVPWDAASAATAVRDHLISKLPGEPWKAGSTDPV